VADLDDAFAPQTTYGDAQVFVQGIDPGLVSGRDPDLIGRSIARPKKGIQGDQ
jgi:hypothetical protein